MLLGDANISSHALGNPGLDVEMVNREFLDWFDEQMEVFTTGVRLRRTAEESRDQSLETGFLSAQDSNYHDTFRVRMRRLPELQQFEEWYSTGEKVFPNNLELTPTIAKMWYCSDGGVKIRESIVRISSYNESDRKEYIVNLFDNIGFDIRFSSQTIRLDKQSSYEFLDWIGSPPPGFEYKWELNDRDRYEKLKDRAYGDGVYEGRFDDENWLDNDSNSQIATGQQKLSAFAD